MPSGIYERVRGKHGRPVGIPSPYKGGHIKPHRQERCGFAERSAVPPASIYKHYEPVSYEVVTREGCDRMETYYA